MWGWRGTTSATGYWRLAGGLFAMYVVELDVVGPAEGDDMLHSSLAWPVEVLRVLPEEYIRSLAPDVQEEIRRRLRRAGG